MQPIHKQVVVITGASSGIGRATALELAARGARLVLAARKAEALEEVANAARELGAQAICVVTDVASATEIKHLADEAVRRFGRVDSWINNAGISEFALVEDMTLDEIERIIQVDLLGPIYGMKVVLPLLKQAGGGTIVNVGSVLSECPAPLQAAYVAAKHALKGFTDSLRLELETQRAPVKLTLVMPGAMNTPFFSNARAKIAGRPRPLGRVYEPTAVARAICEACVHPPRDVYVGGMAKAMSVLQRVSPKLLDRFNLYRGRGVKEQIEHVPSARASDALFVAKQGENRIRGDYVGPTTPTRAFTRSYPMRMPGRAGWLLAGAALLGAAALVFGGERSSAPTAT